MYLQLLIDTQTRCSEYVISLIDIHKSCSRSRQVELGRWRVSEEL